MARGRPLAPTDGGAHILIANDSHKRYRHCIRRRESHAPLSRHRHGKAPPNPRPADRRGTRARAITVDRPHAKAAPGIPSGRTHSPIRPDRRGDRRGGSRGDSRGDRIPRARVDPVPPRGDAVMLIYRSVGVTMIAAIMAAHRQPCRTRRATDVCRDPGAIDGRAAAISERPVPRPDGQVADADPPPAATDRPIRPRGT